MLNGDLESTFRQWHPSLRRAAGCITPGFLADSRLPVHFAPATVTLNASCSPAACTSSVSPCLRFPRRNSLGQWILQVFLHSTAHRSSAVGWIVSLIDQKLECGPIHVNLDILGAYPLDDFCHLETHNLDQVVPLELVEDDYVI